MATGTGSTINEKWMDFNNAGDGETGKLAQLFQPIYDNARTQLNDNYATQLQKLRGSQAARGILRSGVSDYPTTELMKANTDALGGVSSGLANILGNTEASRSLFDTQAKFQDLEDTQNYYRALGLADKIGDANKPSTLQEIFQGASAFAPIATSLAGGGGASALANIFGRGRNAGGAQTGSSDIGGFF